MTESQKKIPCSVGILTYNSEAYLPRALDSLLGFEEIIIADGGSTDRTVDIARKYGCKIIKQSHPGKPIEDFALERNRTLDAATLDWFFYLDSDEVVSDELRLAIEQISKEPHPQYLVYRVQYEKTSADLSVRYRTAKSYYQTRFFNKRSRARFVKPIHERISFPHDVPVGTIEAPWYVPLNVQLDFESYRKKIMYRIDIMAAHAEFKGVMHFLKLAYIIPTLEILKSLIKMTYLLVQRNPNRIPSRYEWYRIYSNIYLMQAYTQRYFRKQQ